VGNTLQKWVLGNYFIRGSRCMLYCERDALSSVLTSWLSDTTTRRFSTANIKTSPLDRALNQFYRFPVSQTCVSKTRLNVISWSLCLSNGSFAFIFLFVPATFPAHRSIRFILLMPCVNHRVRRYVTTGASRSLDCSYSSRDESVRSTAVRSTKQRDRRGGRCTR
jgi:hypothetical protein